MFANFLHVRLYQRADLHRVDVATSTVANLKKKQKDYRCVTKTFCLLTPDGRLYFNRCLSVNRRRGYPQSCRGGEEGRYPVVLSLVLPRGEGGVVLGGLSCLDII